MIFSFVSLLFKAYYLLLIIKILSSWIPNLEDNKFFDIVDKLTEPYLEIFRKFIPAVNMIDFSPILAFIVLGFIERLVYQLLSMII